MYPLSVFVCGYFNIGVLFYIIVTVCVCCLSVESVCSLSVLSNLYTAVHRHKS